MEGKAANALTAVQLSVLSHPTAHPADVEVKAAIVAKFVRMEEVEPVATTLEATFAAHPA